jgi:CheY-like chemotaxis protein
VKGCRIAVLSSERLTRRQVARALAASGCEVEFVGDLATLDTLLGTAPPDLLVLDGDRPEAELEMLLERHAQHPPVVLLALSADRRVVLDLVRLHHVGNFVAKHGALRAVAPVVDERELLATCEKMLSRAIFGVDRYIGCFGVVVHRHTVTSVEDRDRVLAVFEEYLVALDCLPSVVPGMVTVADELILNAIIHAPRDAAGQPKYEAEHLDPQLVLEPQEYVEVAWGSDGQRLMLSVTDHFGRLDDATLYNYLARGLEAEQLEPEIKPSGAGLGLVMSFRSIHQLVFNIEESVRTEVIAGWYLRVNNALEFRQVGKSLNVFRTAA